MNGKWGLITGATAGIGEATALLLASRGLNLVLTGRRGDRLEALKARIEVQYKTSVEIAVCDIQSRTQCEATLLPILERIGSVLILVNNAGMARGIEKFQDGKEEDWDQMIDTNIKGLLRLTRMVLPRMVSENAGHIVNLGSVAGRWVYPGGAVYCATKFAVRAISEALRIDLMGTAIRVTNIEPGMVETEFSEVRLGDKEKAKKVYEGVRALQARDVAETILWCVERPAHVNIQELVLFPTQQAAVGPSYTSR